MKAVARHLRARGVPLRRSDVDTDQIIPAEWLKRVERTGFEKGLFATWRDDRNFVLNDERYAGPSILVAGPAFGVGSSREHAVWAIQQYGFDAVIAPSFSDIFRNNCTKNGLVPGRAARVDASRRIWDAIEADPATEIVVDVERLHRRGAGRRASPSRSRWTPPTQHRFLDGPRRRRHHADPRRRDRRLRGRPPGLADRLAARHPNGDLVTHVLEIGL